jgi:hypothetical protein
MLANMGAGIAMGGASGQPWMAGIAPGAAMASNALEQQHQRDQSEQLQRFQMGLHLQQLKQLQDDRDLKNAGIAAWVKNNSGAAPDAGVPGGGITAPQPPLMVPPVAAAPQGGGINNNNIGNVRPPGASRGFQQPPDFDSGVGLTVANARSYPSTYNGGKPMTLAQIGAHWAPINSSDDPTGLNKNWVPNVAKLSGLDPNAPLDLNDPQTAIAFARGVHGAEKGPQAMRAPEAYAAGVGKGLPEFQIPGMPLPAQVAGASPMPSSGGLPPGASIGLPPELAAPSASPVLPPFQVPGMQPQPAVPTAALQPAIVQGGSDTSPTPVQYKPPQGPPPAMEPPPEPPQVPRPALSAADANELNNMVMTRQITPQQAQAEKDKRINEMWSKQQGTADKKWQQQQENYRFNRGEETKKDVWRPLTPQERDQMLPGSRPDAQLQINSRTGEVKPILSARDTKPDVSQYYQDPEVQKKVAAMSPTDRAAFNAATGSGDHKGASAILTKAQTGLTEEQQALNGDDLLKTLPFGDREIVEGLTTGRLTPTDLSKRAGNGTDFNRLIALASKVDPSYSPGPGGARRAFETKYMSGAGQGQATLLAANTAIQHMQIAHDLVGQLHNGDGQITNTVKNYLKTQFGAGDVTSAHAALQLMGVEIAKTVKGAGSLGLAEEQAAQKLATTSMSDDQINKNIHVLTDFMMGRVHSVEDLAKSHGISDKTVENYISPRSRESLKYIEDNPVGGVKSGAPGQTIKIDMSGKRQ